MRCFIPIKAMHNDERFFPHPETFMPERFSQTSNNAAFMPIGEGKYSFSRMQLFALSFISAFHNLTHLLHYFAGPRQCIGFQFAKLLICTGLVKLLSRFKFSQSEHTTSTIQYSATKNTLIPRDGLRVNVHRI